MGDNLENRGPQDRSKISLTETWEIVYWTKALNCNEKDLREAIQAVGNSSEMVRNYFEK